MILKNLLGEILCRRGDATPEQVQEALRLQRAALEAAGRAGADRHGSAPARVEPLGRTLADRGWIDPTALESALRDQAAARAVWRTVDPERAGRLGDCAAALMTAGHPAEAVHRTLVGALRLTGAAIGVLVLLDAASGGPGFAALLGPRGERMLDVGRLAEDGVLQWVLQRERAALVEEARRDPRCGPRTAWLYGLEAQSMLCVPLQSASGRVGALEVVNRRDGQPFTREDGLLLGSLAELATLALRNTRTLRQLALRLGELRAARSRLEAS